ncbi:hypothetical protein O181_078533 [Austropuccinia psidii MF-1]|uniref:Integrase catalytic domain-containing protein n=1 Tax=Austropuccinia psidii MF-1 TaxID=1389203 RepID=A0A9Q3FEY9_9BASI|nr:hypothetical protein [Austropuccinia psidii MF-1]
MIKMQEPSRPWEILHMDCVTGLPPGGDKSYNTGLVIFDRFGKTPIFLPCQKDDTAMYTALLHYGQTLTNYFGTKLSFLIAYHPQTNGLAERMIQTLEDIVRIFCAYGLGLKDCGGFTHDWCTHLPALALAYKKLIHSSTNQTPAVLEKGWNHRLPQDPLTKDLGDLHPIAASFKGILENAIKHALRCMEDSFAYAKDKWDKSHATPDFKVGYLVPVSTTHFNNIKGCKK